MKKIHILLLTFCLCILLMTSCGPSAQDVSNELCDCFESVTTKQIYTQEDIRFNEDSCTNAIDLKYDISKDEDLKKELDLYAKEQSASLEKVNESYLDQISFIANRVAEVYKNTTNSNWWISDTLYNNISDNLNDTIFSWYGVNNTNEVIDQALNATIVENAIKEFTDKYLDQATRLPIESINFILIKGNNDKYKNKYGTEFNIDDRCLFTFYLPPNFNWHIKSTGEKFIRGYMILARHYDTAYSGTDSSFVILISEEALKNLNNNRKRVNLKRRDTEKKYIDCIYKCFDVTNPDILAGHADAEVLMIGSFKKYDTRKIDYSRLGSWLPDEEVERSISFINCEIIGIYDKLELAIGELNPWDEYTNYLKNKFDKKQENKRITASPDDNNKPEKGSDSSLGLLKGTYQGPFGANELLINIESINEDGAVDGYNVVKNNRRVLTGSVIRNGTNYDFILKEPGDGEWDGVFTFTITENQATGTWKANNGKLSRNFTLEKAAQGKTTILKERSEAKIVNKDDVSKCDKFLKDYEKFMKDYIAILRKYKANPSDMSIMSDYTKMVSEASKWANYDKDCTNNPEFIGKFTEIQMKIANAAAGL